VAGGTKEFLVRASYLEIYNEEIRDLLSKNPQARLELKEHPDRGVYVKDLMQFVVKSVAEIGSVLQVRRLRACKVLHGPMHWACRKVQSCGWLALTGSCRHWQGLAHAAALWCCSKSRYACCSCC
jgi:hypothetical protein